MPTAALAEATPAEIGFLAGARALYYEEQTAMIQAAVGGFFQGGEAHGQ